MGKGLFYVMVFLFVESFYGFCFADILHLKDGQNIEGTITGKTDNSVTIDVSGVKKTFFKDEVEYWERAATIIIKPEAENNYKKGNELFDAGKYVEAVEEFKKSIELDPDFTNSYFNLGIAYRKLGKFQESIGPLQEAAKRDNRFAEAFCNLGSSYYELGQESEAVANVKKAIEIDPQNAAAYCRLSFIYLNTGKFEEAIELGKKSIQIQPDLAEGYANIGFAYKFLGKNQEARDNLSKAKEVFVQQGNNQAAERVSTDLMKLE